MTNQSQKIMLGLSGGVDSAVAAHLLVEQGFDIECLFMKNWDEDDADGYCAAAVDLQDAQAVCQQLQLTLHTANFASEYWEHVFQIFLAEYRAGRTPNPDVLCNREIKFKTFLEHARGLGRTQLATGHYAQIKFVDGIAQLCKAVDRNKDQSYFLHLLNQEQLGASLFPLGTYTKPQVRQIAAQLGLVNQSKKDSTGICFIGERKFKDFLQQYLPAQPGEMINENGKVIGQHDGLMYYTIGQRQGLLIGGSKAGTGEPWFVAGKDLDNNKLILVQGSEHPLLYRTSLEAQQIHWIAGTPPDEKFKIRAKTRYRQDDQDCLIQLFSQSKALVTFDQPQRAIAPGQSVVFYQEEVCLGGGVIS